MYSFQEAPSPQWGKMRTRWVEHRLSLHCKVVISRSTFSIAGVEARLNVIEINVTNYIVLLLFAKGTYRKH